MAEVLAHETHSHGHHEVDENALWEGGQEPLKASYGKLMMWYFLVSDAFTFSAFQISYGALRFSMPSWPVPDFVFAKIPFSDAHLPLVFVTFMTFVLIASSVTMVRAVQEGARMQQKRRCQMDGLDHCRRRYVPRLPSLGMDDADCR